MSLDDFLLGLAVGLVIGLVLGVVAVLLYEEY